MAKLEPFEGVEVTKTSIAITKAGDGLSKALKVKPQTFKLGQTVYVLMECEVEKIRHEENEGDTLTRVHVLKAGTATMVTKKLAEEHIKAQKAEIEKAEDAAAGVNRIPGTAPYADEDDDGEDDGESGAD